MSTPVLKDPPPLPKGKLVRGDRFRKIWQLPSEPTAPVDRHNLGYDVSQFPGSRFFRPKEKLHPLL